MASRVLSHHSIAFPKTKKTYSSSMVNIMWLFLYYLKSLWIKNNKGKSGFLNVSAMLLVESLIVLYNVM